MHSHYDLLKHGRNQSSILLILRHNSRCGRPSSLMLNQSLISNSNFILKRRLLSGIVTLILKVMLQLDIPILYSFALTHILKAAVS